MVRVVLALMLAALPASAAELKVATWNLNWLTTRERAVPENVKLRSQEDFDLLAVYAAELDADVVAIEEVDGFQAATKVFPREKYSIHMTQDRLTQRVGIAVRRGLRYEKNPDLTALAGNHLRSGADITLHVGAVELRILAVHLKSGCRDQKLTRPKGRSCVELKDQIAPLAAWIADREAEKVPFLVLGDFNRWMDRGDALMAALREAAPLSRATEGKASPCWGAENFIDHILAGGPAIDWMKTETLKVMTYREKDPALKEKLSDHCPVSVRVVVPG
jgi:hypothetical protein